MTATRPPPPVDGPRVVALGGGHGLAASLQALRHVTPHVTAVVTVADDGGSSGRLREELGILPPGDLRMALAALAGRDDWGRTWEGLLQHRFGGDGPLAGHAVGNLLIAGLIERTGDPVAALDLAGQLVGAVGRVLPMCRSALEICADVEGLAEQVAGQVAVATTTGRVTAVHLRPSDPAACEESLAAVRDADWVVLGPGSWFTSVLPHLLVPALREALGTTRARVLVCLNLAAQAGETTGFSPEEHLEVLRAHAPELRLDAVLADRDAVGDPRGLMAFADAAGAHLVLAPVARGDGTPRHSPDRLAVAYRRVLTTNDHPLDSSSTPEAQAWR
ncbi:MAG: hypothetical protein JWN08_2514 [Frankiales bacterium]|nr:hypothetical protein [Frankiales bacterium]